ncbi:MAG: NAD(P)/FAD-dependent oxidoreductase [Pseudomonadota bacterium]
MLASSVELSGSEDARPMGVGESDILDVLIVGAGISGISAACHLERTCPDHSYLIVEARNAVGGTWDLFRYPGVRSDSDMYTLGFGFRPWTDARAIADGETILNYVRATADEYGLAQHIRFGERLCEAHWDTPSACWTAVTENDEGEQRRRARMLVMCAGYYNYDTPHRPDFPHEADFQGRIVHPQHWPDDLDYADQRVVVIGSGATAMTLVPAMAARAASMTLLQRSPTYVIASRAEDRLARALLRWFPARAVYAALRWRNVQIQRFFYALARRRPDAVRRILIRRVAHALTPDYDVASHFTPRYQPWDQRLCLIPDADLLKSIRRGQTQVVTDQIERFTPTGIRLASGEHLDADLIVTATGLQLQWMGGVALHVDGVPVDFANTLTYKGMMYSNVPNLVHTFGYVNASWTLRADLTSRYLCRILGHMRNTGTTIATPIPDAQVLGAPKRAWIEDFTPGYMRRAMHLFPRQGSANPWRNTQNYAEDRKLARGRIDDGTLRFAGPATAT